MCKYGRRDLDGFEWRHADLGCQTSDAWRAYRHSTIFNTPTCTTNRDLDLSIHRLQVFELRFCVLWPCEDAKPCAPLTEV